MPAEHEIFLVGLAVLLAAARVLGELSRRLRFPAVTLGRRVLDRVRARPASRGVRRRASGSR